MCSDQSGEGIRSNLTALDILKEMCKSEQVFYLCFEGIYLVLCGEEGEALDLLKDAVGFAVDIAADQEPDSDGRRRFKAVLL